MAYLSPKARLQVMSGVFSAPAAVLHHLIIPDSDRKDCGGIEERMPAGNLIDKTKTERKMFLVSESAPACKGQQCCCSICHIIT